MSAADAMAEALIAGFGKMIPRKRDSKRIVAGGRTYALEELRRWADKTSSSSELNANDTGALLHELLDVYEASTSKPKKPEPQLAELQAEVKDLTADIQHAVKELTALLVSKKVDRQLLRNVVEELKASIAVD